MHLLFPPPSWRSLLPLLALGSLLALPCAAAPAPEPLGAALGKAAGRLPAGGFVLAEVQDGTVTFATAGQPHPRAGLAPEKVIFEIGSITKVFTGLLLAQAVLEQKAALTDSIARHLPAEVGLRPAAAAITLEQLATHTSGLPALPTNFEPENPADPYAGYTVNRLYAFLREYEPEGAPPQRASYSNIGFGLLGHVLERIFGQSYAALIAERITKPLGLRDTVIALNAEQRSRFATPHSGSVAVVPWHFDALAGAGALRSTAADLARFAQALLNGENAALSAAWDLVREPRSQLGAAPIGLATLIARRGSDTVYHHSGGTGGFRSFLEIAPGTRGATVVLVNNDAAQPGAIVSAARRSAEPPGPFGASGSTREEVPIAPARLAEYVGVYPIDARGRFTFVLDEQGRLLGRLTGQPFLPVFHAGDDRFFARAVAAEFQFGRAADGKIDRVTLHQGGHTVPAPRSSVPAPRILFPSRRELQPYVGRYTLAPNVLFEIDVRGSSLVVKLTGQEALPVFCDAPDHFVYDVVEAALTFERDAAGAVTAVTLHQNGRDSRAPRLPDPPAKK